MRTSSSSGALTAGATPFGGAASDAATASSVVASGFRSALTHRSIIGLSPSFEVQAQDVGPSVQLDPAPRPVVEGGELVGARRPLTYFAKAGLFEEGCQRPPIEYDLMKVERILLAT